MPAGNLGDLLATEAASRGLAAAGETPKLFAPPPHPPRHLPRVALPSAHDAPSAYALFGGMGSTGGEEGGRAASPPAWYCCWRRRWCVSC